MKSLLGALALVTLMGAGAWSSDALSGFDAPEHGRHQRERAEDKAADKAEKARTKAEERAGKRAEKDADRPGHPHGGPPGQQQRDRGEPPDWAGGPDKRTAEPPGLANKPADHPAKTHGRP